MKFYTSDLHLNHANIIKYCNRPFDSVGEMDSTIITRWNKAVKPTDEVYLIGDVGFYRDEDKFDSILSSLNGKKYLIYGNHDKQIKTSERLQSHFEYCRSYDEIHDSGEFIVLCHYSMRVWNKSHHGAIMLYGHSHGTLPGDAQSTDVGTDCWNFTPVTLKQIKRRLATLPARKPVDKHGE